MKKGFTLVELLVAATIIAVLATIGVTSYNSLSVQSRDSKRKSDLENLRSALELYRSDNDYYPASLPTLAATSNQYIKTVPDDPKTDRDYIYCPILSGTNYVDYSLYAALEADLTDKTGMCADCVPGDDAKNCNYQLTPLGGE